MTDIQGRPFRGKRGEEEERNGRKGKGEAQKKNGREGKEEGKRREGRRQEDGKGMEKVAGEREFLPTVNFRSRRPCVQIHYTTKIKDRQSCTIPFVTRSRQTYVVRQTG